MTRHPAKPKPKSLLHLLFLPLGFLGGAVFCYATVQLACVIAGLVRGEEASFSSFAEPAKILIVLPMLLASIPVSLLLANSFLWILPPARRFFHGEALERGGEDFVSASRVLLQLVLFSTPALFCVALGVAVFSR